MFQSFDIKGGPELGRANLPKLREAMRAVGLDIVYVPHEDEFQNEYLPEANERLAWATGFTGSAGSALIGTDFARLFVDGRYTLQAETQVDTELFDVETVAQGGPEAGVFRWLSLSGERSGARIGYDPRLMSPNDADALHRAADSIGAEAVAVSENPIDAAWTDRPAQPCAPIRVHPMSFAGRSVEDKLSDLVAALKASKVDAVLLSSPASIAWLLNLRGGDVAHTPLPLSRLLVRTTGRMTFYVDTRKLGDDVREHLGETVKIQPIEAADRVFEGARGRRVSLDPGLVPAFFFQQAEATAVQIVRQQDPTALPRARKNRVELAGAQRAHVRDGVAVTRFLRWLDAHAGDGKLTEIDAVEALEGFRERSGGLQDISFETISGAGPNGAIIHYRVSTATNRRIERNSLFLVDSGGQYRDGTTDITRTIAIGTPTSEMCRHYTLVLKGHIALACARFPEGTTGVQLDTLARHALWQAGLDYAHGTGHGVGAYLGVHEGPQRISKALNPYPLQPGMIVSNEPGYYKPGGYGIRIENLQYVTAPEAIEGGVTEMMGFHVLTLAPLDRRLIDATLLTAGEREWVNAYHQRVRAEIGLRLTEEELVWLSDACSAI